MRFTRYSSLTARLVREGLTEKRDSVIRPDTGTRQRMEIEEVAGGVEAPADARKMAGAEAPAEWEALRASPNLARRSMATVSHAAAQGRRRAPAVVIDLSVEREKRHAAARDGAASKSREAGVIW